MGLNPPKQNYFCFGQKQKCFCKARKFSGFGFNRIWGLTQSIKFKRKLFKMKFYLISDNHDTALGFRLAKIEGTIVSDKEETEKAIDEAVKDEDIAIMLITKKAAEFVPEKLNDIKLNKVRPLVVEVPDRHITADDDISNVADYVKDAVGVKL